MTTEKGIEMKDKRAAMCDIVNYFGDIKGDFMPCIDSAKHVNYIAGMSRISVALPLLEELYDLTMERREVGRKWEDLSRNIKDEMRVIHDLFLAQNAIDLTSNESEV
jgi:hypothetical protein